MKRTAVLLAVILAELATAQSPAPQGGALTEARALIEQGVWFEAVGLLERHLKTHPDDVEARFDLAQTLFRLERYREAVDAAQEVLARRPDHEGGQRLLIRIRMNLSGRLDWTRLDDVVEFARLCARMESYDRARACYLHVLKHRDDPAVRRELAAMLAWAKRYEEAAAQYRRYLDQRPDDAEARYALGCVYNALGRLPEAEAELRRAAGERPHFLFARVEWAKTLIWLNEDEAADRLLAEAIARDATSIEPRLWRARLFLRHGRVEEAHTLLQEILRLQSDHAEARALLKDLEESRSLEIARLRRRLRENPDREDDRQRLIELLLETRRPGEALREIEQWTGRRPADFALQERLVQLREAQRRAVLERVIRYCAERDPVTGVTVERLAVWTRAHPDDARAREMYARAEQRARRRSVHGTP